MTITEFWTLTIAEVTDFVNYQAKSHIRNNYELSSLIAGFVSLTMSGKKIPPIERIYPSLFFEDEAPKNNERALAQMQAWAIKHNEVWSKRNDPGQIDS